MPSPPRRAASFAALQSLKWRLTLGTLLALAIGLLALGAALIGRATRDTVDAQRIYEIGDAAQTAAVLSRRVIELQRALQAVAAQLDPATLDDEARLHAFLAGKPVLLSMFHNLAVTGVDGHARVRHDARGLHRTALYLGDSDQLRRTIAERRPVISPPLPSRVTGEPIVVLTQPLVNASGVYGVMFGTLQLAHREVLADLVDLKREDGRALMIVTDSEGRILAHPDADRLLQPLAVDPQFAQAHGRWVEAGQPIEPAGLAFEQPGALVTAAGVAGPDWVVWRALPESQLLAPLQGTRGFALAWGGGLLAAMALMTLGLIGLELRPLARLERRAARLFDGAIPPGAGWPAARGEIGSLAAVLKQAAIDRAELEARNRQTLRRLEWSATHDALTGLANREAFDARLARLFEAPEGRADDERPAAALTDDAWPQAVPTADTRPQAVLTPDARPQAALTPDTRPQAALTDDARPPAASTADARPPAAISEDARSPAALVAIDLDRFKPINDDAGHAAGDQVLKAVARAIVGCVRSGDLVARTGGDEFAVLLERCGGDGAQRVADEIRRAIARLGVPWQQRLLHVGASVGVAPLDAGIDDPDQWKQAADIACYAAKAAGRNGRLRAVNGR